MKIGWIEGECKLNEVKNLFYYSIYFKFNI